MLFSVTTTARNWVDAATGGEQQIAYSFDQVRGFEEMKKHENGGILENIVVFIGWKGQK